MRKGTSRSKSENSHHRRERFENAQNKVQLRVDPAKRLNQMIQVYNMKMAQEDKDREAFANRQRQWKEQMTNLCEQKDSWHHQVTTLVKSHRIHLEKEREKRKKEEQERKKYLEEQMVLRRIARVR
jgi:hypothetical protein